MLYSDEDRKWDRIHRITVIMKGIVVVLALVMFGLLAWLLTR